MLERGLDPLAAGHDGAEPGGDVARRAHPDLVGDLRAHREHEPLAVLRGADLGEEPLVVLPVDEHVGVRFRAELVTPDLVRAHGVVRSGVEEVPAVGRPGRRVVRPLDDIVPIGGAVADGEVAESHGVLLGPVPVAAPRQHRAVGREVEDPEGEVVAVACFDVRVEQDLLASSPTSGLSGSGGSVSPVGGGHPAVDGVLLRPRSSGRSTSDRPGGWAPRGRSPGCGP